MNQFQCSICKAFKSIDDFAWKKINVKRQSHCRVCQRTISGNWYRKNRAVHSINVRRNSKKYRAAAQALLRKERDKPCADCGVRYEYWVMQFDHRPASGKEFDLATAPGRGMSLKRILAEIAKCDVVCANCHCERTHNRRSKKRQSSSGFFGC